MPPLTVLAVGGSGWQAGVGMLVAVGAVTGAFAVTRRWGPVIGRLLSHPESEQLLLRVLGVTLVVAGLAEFVGASGDGLRRRIGLHGAMAANTNRPKISPRRQLTARRARPCRPVACGRARRRDRRCT
jgi:CPA2 family monovalent cation:H+ antiporter-2